MPLPTPLLSLALQTVPILVFLVVDALVQDPRWAIGAALAFVIVQTVLGRARGRPFDRFLLLDFALISGLGTSSLITRDELFFKLKPALLEGVMVPYLGFLALARQRTLLGYFDRFGLGGATPSPAALPLMRRLLGAMAVLVALHAGLTVMAALRWSKQSWGLIWARVSTACWYRSWPTCSGCAGATWPGSAPRRPQRPGKRPSRRSRACAAGADADPGDCAIVAL